MLANLDAIFDNLPWGVGESWRQSPPVGPPLQLAECCAPEKAIHVVTTKRRRPLLRNGPYGLGIAARSV
jgi:hypothetical protein